MLRGKRQAASEWCFRILPKGEKERRPLVPDVAFVRYERLLGLSDDDQESPPFAPDVAFEIYSVGDRRRDILHKVDVYLRGGSDAVVLVDPRDRSLEIHERRGMRRLTGDATFALSSLPGFTFPLDRLFAAMDLPTSFPL